MISSDDALSTTPQKMKGQEIVWELPIGNPVGTMMFAHGCHHSAGDLWPPSEECPQCLGLPEEMRLRAAILRRRLAVIGISSLDRVDKRCWSEVKKDKGANVAAILRNWIKREGLEDLPLFVVGASSGGQLVLTLPSIMEEIEGVYAQVRGVDDSVFELPNQRPFPSTAFVHMPRDEDNAVVIARNIKTLRSKGTPVLEVRISPRPVTVSFLTERSPLIDVPAAQVILEALKTAGVAADNGTLLQPPRPVTEVWASIAASKPEVGNLSFVLDESHVGELVNLAWAKHELVSDEAEAVIKWMQEGGEGDLDTAKALLRNERLMLETHNL